MQGDIGQEQVSSGPNSGINSREKAGNPWALKEGGTASDHSQVSDVTSSRLENSCTKQLSACTEWEKTYDSLMRPVKGLVDEHTGACLYGQRAVGDHCLVKKWKRVMQPICHPPAPNVCRCMTQGEAKISIDKSKEVYLFLGLGLLFSSSVLISMLHLLKRSEKKTGEASVQEVDLSQEAMEGGGWESTISGKAHAPPYRSDSPLSDSTTDSAIETCVKAPETTYVVTTDGRGNDGERAGNPVYVLKQESELSQQTSKSTERWCDQERWLNLGVNLFSVAMFLTGFALLLLFRTMSYDRFVCTCGECT